VRAAARYLREHTDRLIMPRFLALAALLLSACSTTQAVDLDAPREVAQAHERVQGQRAVVLRTDGAAVRGRIEALRADSVVVLAQPGMERVRIETDRVASIEARVFRRPAVTRVGFTLGAAAGFGLVAIGAAFFGEEFSPAAVGASVGAAAVGGAVGAYAYPHPSDDEARGRFVFE
jgi:hypothetical protein